MMRPRWKPHPALLLAGLPLIFLTTSTLAARLPWTASDGTLVLAMPDAPALVLPVDLRADPSWQAGQPQSCTEAGGRVHLVHPLVRKATPEDGAGVVWHQEILHWTMDGAVWSLAGRFDTGSVFVSDLRLICGNGRVEMVYTGYADPSVEADGPAGCPVEINRSDIILVDLARPERCEGLLEEHLYRILSFDAAEDETGAVHIAWFELPEMNRGGQLWHMWRSGESWSALTPVRSPRQKEEPHLFLRNPSFSQEARGFVLRAMGPCTPDPQWQGRWNGTAWETLAWMPEDGFVATVEDVRHAVEAVPACDLPLAPGMRAGRLEFPWPVCSGLPCMPGSCCCGSEPEIALLRTPGGGIVELPVRLPIRRGASFPFDFSTWEQVLEDYRFAVAPDAHRLSAGEAVGLCRIPWVAENAVATAIAPARLVEEADYAPVTANMAKRRAPLASVVRADLDGDGFEDLGALILDGTGNTRLLAWTAGSRAPRVLGAYALDDAGRVQTTLGLKKPNEVLFSTSPRAARFMAPPGLVVCQHPHGAESAGVVCQEEVTWAWVRGAWRSFTVEE